MTVFRKKERRSLVRGQGNGGGADEVMGKVGLRGFWGGRSWRGRVKSAVRVRLGCVGLCIKNSALRETGRWGGGELVSRMGRSRGTS